MLNNDVEINMLDSNLLITSSEKESAQMERATNRDRQLLGEDSSGTLVWGDGTDTWDSQLHGT